MYKNWIYIRSKRYMVYLYALPFYSNYFTLTITNTANNVHIRNTKKARATRSNCSSRSSSTHLALKCLFINTIVQRRGEIVLVEKSNNFWGESLVYFMQNLEQNLLTTRDTDKKISQSACLSLCLSVCLCIIMFRERERDRDTQRETHRETDRQR